MENILALALVKLLDKSVKDLAPGLHRVDETVTLRVTADIRRGDDVQYTPTTSVPLKATLAFMLQRMGLQREAAVALLCEAMTLAIVSETSATDEVKALIKDVDTAMTRVESVCTGLPLKTRKGATTVKGTVTVVADLPEAA